MIHVYSSIKATNYVTCMIVLFIWQLPNQIAKSVTCQIEHVVFHTGNQQIVVLRRTI